MRNHLNLRANIALGLIFAFLLNTLGPLPFAQAQEFRLPAPGVMVPLSPEFNPPILKGIKVHPDNPFRFDFIMDTGGDTSLRGASFATKVLMPDTRSSSQSLKEQSTKLIKYFLASLTIPEKDLWVNLSPYEKNRIIPQSFGLTEMGRDLLAEDYMLKQITASLIYPEGEIGKKFWKRIYEEAAKKFGTTNIPVNTFNKVWIVPEKAIVYENAKAGTAYVVEAKLKVMLEQDYLSLSRHSERSEESQSNVNALGSQIVREIVIPELTKEVNEGKNFSQLRQVYNSLILATWYKKKIKDSILEQVYADKKKVTGVGYEGSVIADNSSLRGAEGDAAISDTEKIYQRYLQAFKKGVYNYIKEDKMPNCFDSVSGCPTIARKYFSGGMQLLLKPDEAMFVIDQTPQGFKNRGDLEVVSAGVVMLPRMRDKGDQEFLNTIQDLLIIGTKNGKRYRFLHVPTAALAETAIPEDNFKIMEIDQLGNTVNPERDLIGFFSISPLSGKNYFESDGKPHLVLNRMFIRDDHLQQGIYSGLLNVFPGGTILEGKDIQNEPTLIYMLRKITDYGFDLTGIFDSNEIRNLMVLINNSHSFNSLPAKRFLEIYQQKAVSKRFMSLEDIFRKTPLGKALEKSGFHINRITFEENKYGKEMNFVSTKLSAVKISRDNAQLTLNEERAVTIGVLEAGRFGAFPIKKSKLKPGAHVEVFWDKGASSLDLEVDEYNPMILRVSNIHFRESTSENTAIYGVTSLFLGQSYMIGRMKGSGRYYFTKDYLPNKDWQVDGHAVSESFGILNQRGRITIFGYPSIKSQINILTVDPAMNGTEVKESSGIGPNVQLIRPKYRAITQRMGRNFIQLLRDRFVKLPYMSNKYSFDSEVERINMPFNDAEVIVHEVEALVDNAINERQSALVQIHISQNNNLLEIKISNDKGIDWQTLRNNAVRFSRNKQFKRLESGRYVVDKGNYYEGEIVDPEEVESLSKKDLFFTKGLSRGKDLLAGDVGGSGEGTTSVLDRIKRMRGVFKVNTTPASTAVSLIFDLNKLLAASIDDRFPQTDAETIIFEEGGIGEDAQLTQPKDQAMVTRRSFLKGGVATLALLGVGKLHTEAQTPEDLLKQLDILDLTDQKVDQRAKAILEILVKQKSSEANQGINLFLQRFGLQLLAEIQHKFVGLLDQEQVEVINQKIRGAKYVRKYDFNTGTYGGGDVDFNIDMDTLLSKDGESLRGALIHEIGHNILDRKGGPLYKSIKDKFVNGKIPLEYKMLHEMFAELFETAYFGHIVSVKGILSEDEWAYTEINVIRELPEVKKNIGNAVFFKGLLNFVAGAIAGYVNSGDRENPKRVMTKIFDYLNYSEENIETFKIYNSADFYRSLEAYRIKKDEVWVSAPDRAMISGFERYSPHIVAFLGIMTILYNTYYNNTLKKELDIIRHKSYPELKEYLDEMGYEKAKVILFKILKNHENLVNGKSFDNDFYDNIMEYLESYSARDALKAFKFAIQSTNEPMFLIHVMDRLSHFLTKLSVGGPIPKDARGILGALENTFNYFRRDGYSRGLIDRADSLKSNIEVLLDSAMIGKNTGGIDLTPANMNLQTQNGGSAIKFHLDPAMLQQLQNAPGFVPVIINIQPLKDLSAFLGIT